MKLFFYELIKNIFRLPLLIMIIAFALVNLYKLNETFRLYSPSDYYGSGDDPVYTDGIYEQYKGEMTEQKIKQALEYQQKMDAIISSGNYDTKNPSSEFYTGFAFADKLETDRLIENMQEIYLYPNDIIALRRQADENISFYTGKSSFEVNKILLIKALYHDRIIPVYGRYRAFDMYFDYEFSSLLIILLIIFAFAPSFVKEKSIGANRTIISCGRARSVFWAKHCSMYLFVLIMTVIFAVFDLIYFGSLYGLEFIEQPLYAMADYRYTPFAITVGGALVFSVIGKLIAFLFIGELVMLISTFGKNIGACVAVSLAGIIGLILISEQLPEFLSPINLVNMKNQLSSFEVVGVFGIPIPAPAFTAAVSLVLTVIAHIICYIRTVPKIKTGGAV